MRNEDESNSKSYSRICDVETGSLHSCARELSVGFILEAAVSRGATPIVVGSHPALAARLPAASAWPGPCARPLAYSARLSLSGLFFRCSNQMEGRRIRAPIFLILKSDHWIYGQIRQLLTPLSGSALSVEREVGSDGPEIARIWLKGSLQIVFGGY